MSQYFLYRSRAYEEGFEAFETKEEVIAYLTRYGLQPGEFTLVKGEVVNPKQVTRITEWEI